MPKRDRNQKDHWLDYYGFGYVLDQLSDDMRDAVREVAYKNGITDYNVIKVLSIVLRDRMIELNEEVKQNGH